MKKIDKILTLLIVLALLFLIGKQCVTSFKGRKDKKIEVKTFDISIENIKQNLPDADAIILKDTALYYVVNKEQQEIGTVLTSSPYTDRIIGFNGTIPFCILLNKENQIVNITLFDNYETPNYINRVKNSGLLQSWNGMTPAQAVDKQVDAISGATFSSKAIIQSVQKRLTVLDRQLQPKETWDWSLFYKQLCVIIVMILALICFFNPSKTKTLRFITILLSVCILGFWNSTLLSLALFYSWLTHGIPLAIQIPLIIIALLAILLPLFTKKAFYCTYLCPFGALQEFAGELCGEKIKISANTFKVIIMIRKIILLIILILVAIGVGLDLSWVEPFSAFGWQTVGFGMAIFAIVIIAASVFIRKPWCNFLCPTGLLLELVRKIKK